MLAPREDVIEFDDADRTAFRVAAIHSFAPFLAAPEQQEPIARERGPGPANLALKRPRIKASMDGLDGSSSA
jgi:hypothetical protein